MDYSNLKKFCDKAVNPDPNIEYSIGDELVLLKKDGEYVLADVLEEIDNYPENRDIILKDVRAKVLKSKFTEVKKNKNFKKWLRNKKIKINYVIDNNLYDNVLSKYIISFYKNKFDGTISKDILIDKSIHHEVYGFFCTHFQEVLLDSLDEHLSVNQIMKQAIKEYLEYRALVVDDSNQEYFSEDGDNKLEKVIFKSYDARITFFFLLDKFNITKDNCLKRGVQAKLNAIWGCPPSKNQIFREHCELKDYIDYLNNTFDVKYSNRTMSDGSNYHVTIHKWLSEKG